MSKAFDADSFDTRKLSIALREIEARLSKGQLDDLRYLYESTKGLPFTVDSNNRPQGPTIRTCQLVGSLLNRHIGMGPKYGMNWLVVPGEPPDTFTMRKNVREALQILGWFNAVTPSASRKEIALVPVTTQPDESTYPRQDSISETSYRAWIEQRLGQDKFRRNLISYWVGCAVTGCTLQDVLIASHIVPWAIATPEERLDVFNGLLLTATLDKLFDSFLITFTSKGEIRISKLIPKNAMSMLGISTNMKLRNLDHRHLPYLQRHESKFRIEESRR